MATNDPVTFYSSVDDIYAESSTAYQHKRWNALTHAFTTEHGHPPTHIVRAPGRINLIGEHVDYCLFGVMPAAVEMDTIIAVSSSPSSPTSGCQVHLSNLDTQWPKTCINVKISVPGNSAEQGQWDVGLHGGKMGWDAYIRAALSCILENFFPTISDSQPRSLNLMVSGTIPPGSGLSSSAALIVASLIAMMVGNDITNPTTGPLDRAPSHQHVTNAQLVQLARDSELKLGLRNGGMDQSASVLSRAGAGLFINFYPKLEVEAINLPSMKRHVEVGTSSQMNGRHGEREEEERVVMVIANSLATHNLASDAPRHYNLRVVETLIAARLLDHNLHLSPEDSEKRLTLREVVGLYAKEKEGRMGPDELERALVTMLSQVESVLGSDERLKREGYTVQEMAERSGLNETTFRERYIDFIEVRADTFHLYDRTKHILSESLRVLQFRRLCLSAGSMSGQKVNDVVQSLGRLMDDSHASCRDQYDCSAEELNELAEVCKRGGSLGSRLSGAGWGGCVVSLVLQSKEQEFIDYITSSQTGYSKYRGMNDEQVKGVVFKSVPGSGAGVVAL